jgi:hypothetical protein
VVSALFHWSAVDGVIDDCSDYWVVTVTDDLDDLVATCRGLVWSVVSADIGWLWMCLLVTRQVMTFHLIPLS